MLTVNQILSCRRQNSLFWDKLYLLQTDSAKFESSTTFQTLETGRYFWPTLSLYNDSPTASGLFQGTASYYWSPDSGKHLKVEYQIEPGGGWTYYEYYDDFDKRGMVKTITRPYLDSFPNNPQPPANANGDLIVTEFTYANAWDNSKTLPEEVITKLKGSSGALDKVISRTAYSYSSETYGGVGVWVTTKNAYFGAGANEKTTTVTKRFRPDVPHRALANLPFAEQHADGTKDVWNYEAGEYDELTKAFATYPNPSALFALTDGIVVSGHADFNGVYFYNSLGDWYNSQEGDNYIIGSPSGGWHLYKGLDPIFCSYSSPVLIGDSWGSQTGPACTSGNPSTRYRKPSIREWKISCYSSSAPGAIALGIDGSYVVPNKSTVELKTRDKFGRLRRVDTLVCSGSAGGSPIWEILTSEAHAYDAAGNLILTSKLMDGEITQPWVKMYETQYTDRNGEFETYANISFDNTANQSVHYTGRKQYEKDRSGSIKRFYYDEYGRVSRLVTLQPPDFLAGSVTPPAVPPSTQTSFTYDADNRVLATSVRAAGTADDSGALISQTAFNLAGFPTNEIVPGGYTTVTDYGQIGNRVITKKMKGLNDTSFDRTVSRSTYVDRRSKAVYSTGANLSAAAIPEYHTYSVENLLGENVTINGVTMQVGTPRDVVSRGNNTSHTVRSSTKDYDWAGRVKSEKSVNPSTPINLGDLVTSYSYNTKGQLASTVTGDLAPVLYKYDGFGQLWRSGIDLNGNDALDLTSMDRISDQETLFYKDASGTWWEKTVNTTYPQDNNVSPLTVKQTLVQRSKWQRANIAALGQSFPNSIPDSRTLVVDTSGIFRTNLTFISRDFALVYNRDALGLCYTVGPDTVCQKYSETLSVNGQPAFSYNSDNDSQVYSWYDAYGRQIQTRGRTGDSATFYRQGSTEVTWQRATDNTWTLTGYDPAGRVKVVTNYTDKLAGSTPPLVTAPGKATRYEYNLRGQTTKVWGDVPHPIQNIYIDDGSALGGELDKQLTYNGTAPNWKGTSWPTGSEGTANTTKFTYWSETGLLKTKEYWTGSAWQAISYEYNQRRDLTKRQWQRGTSPNNTTTYNYRETAGEKTGELESVDYGDPNETDLSYTYKRSGALASATDAAGTRSFSYRSSDQQLDYQDLPAATYGTGLKLGLSYDPNLAGRISGYWFGATAMDSQLSATYQYWDVGVTGWDDRSGRLRAISSTLGSFAYLYYPGSSLIYSIYGPLIGPQQFFQARQYAADSDLLTDSYVYTGPDPFHSAALFAGYNCRYDTLHRMTNLTQIGQIYQNDSYNTGLTLRMRYNDRNELINVTNFLSGSPDTITAGTPTLTRRRSTFAYDTTGNRLSTKIDTDNGDNGWSYTPNVLCQYTARQNPPFLEVNGLVGKSPTTISVSVNGGAGINLSRLGLGTGANSDYFYTTPNRVTPTSTKMETVVLTTANPAATETRNILARANSESFTYDTDGNLTDDAAWHYTYDAENRVRTVETLSSLLSAFGTASVKLKLTYDFLGRRVKKEVYNYTGSAWPGTPNATYTYLYNGMTMIAEFTGTTPILSKSYYWGLDMSGSIQGAGGVGGLLGMIVHTTNKRYAAINDCIGNVVGMLDLDLGVLTAEYEYSPFGEPLRAFGSVAGVNPWRFSTKYYDAETGLLNYGYRYYSPSLGRFLNRDPKDELGRLQLSAPLSGGSAAAWSYIGALIGVPGKSPALTPGTPAGLAQSNERQDGAYRNSTQAGDVLAHRKGNPSRGGGGSISTPYRGGGAVGASHPYGFVNNNPYSAIDPFGLWEWYNPFSWFGGSFGGFTDWLSGPSSFNGPSSSSPNLFSNGDGVPINFSGSGYDSGFYQSGALTEFWAAVDQQRSVRDGVAEWEYMTGQRALEHTYLTPEQRLTKTLEPIANIGLAAMMLLDLPAGGLMGFAEMRSIASVMDFQSRSLYAEIYVARQTLARDFLLESGISKSKVGDFMKGINFNYPVHIVDVRAGTTLNQYSLLNESSGNVTAIQGNWYSSGGSSANSLGIYGGGSRALFDYTAISDTRALQSIAAPAVDTWTVRGWAVQTEGGASQLFAPESWKIMPGR